MKVEEVKKTLVGKRCKAILFSNLEPGVITQIEDNSQEVRVHVEFDEPVTWGNGYFRRCTNFARKEDGFGSLQHLILI